MKSSQARYLKKMAQPFKPESSKSEKLHLVLKVSNKKKTGLSHLISHCCMASPASGQDESNPALRLATRADKIDLSCPLGNTRCFPQEKFRQKPCNKSFIDQACSVKMIMLLTKREGRTGRISARGLGSTDLAALGPYENILPVRFRASLVNKRFITRLKKAKTCKNTSAGSFGTMPGPILREYWTSNRAF